jgi:hypothetical protein
MNLRRRLQRLECLCPATPSLTDAERLRRLNELLAYRGDDDPDMLARQERVVQLVRQWREERLRGREGRVRRAGAAEAGEGEGCNG